MRESNGQSSPFDFSLDEPVEFVPCDGFCSESTHRVNDFQQLLISIAVFELLIDVNQVREVELAFALNVQQCEVGFSALLCEGAADFSC